MHRFRLLLFFMSFMVGISNLYSSHIVGGYIRYECLGSTGASIADYRVTVVLYRDVVRGNPGAAFTPTIPLTIFDQGNSSVATLNMQSTKFIADSIEDPCFVRVDSLQLEEGVYSGTITLRKEREHLLVYQRCCRNNSIDNLIKPTDDWGSTWTIEVPAFNAVGCNDSPNYLNNPPIAFCPNQPINLDLSATDADGDSLAYSFCAPFTSPQINPQPNPAFSPPYSFVGFLAPQTPQFPLPSNPALSFDPSTGILSGTPTSIGQYVVGFCIEEYRNGLLLSTSRRDIQINTANCSPIILTAVQDQTLLCDGRTVNFQNNTPPVPGYKIKGYRWDFGDPTTLADTSRLKNPSYTYPDTGLYTITLIANPGVRCSSITTKNFQVYDLLDPQIEFEGLLCEDSNSVTFIAGGAYEDHATILWNFGPNASILNSTDDTVRNVTFSGPPSTFSIGLTVSQDICNESRSSTIRLTPNPVANFQSDFNRICAPFPVSFTNRSLNTDQPEYLWTFGDGNSSSLANPVHMYQQSGNYEVKLEVRNTGVCKDTVTFIDSIFASTVYSPNEIHFRIEPKEGCPPLKVNFIDSSIYRGSGRYFWDLDDNNLSNDISPVFSYQDSGYYDVGLLLITADTCADTLQLKIDSAIRVLPGPKSVLSISEDSVTLKEALIEIDGSASEDYTSGKLLIDDRFYTTKENYIHRFKDTGVHIIDWITINEFACQDTASSELYIYDEFMFEIPNIFTPNGDGINDAFKIRACGVYDFKMLIYNRYGKKVFTTTSLLEGWNGYINEHKASPGVYYYQIVIRDLNGDIKNYEGSLSLLYE